MKKYLFFLLFLAIGAMSCQKDIESSNTSGGVVSPLKSAYDSQTFSQPTVKSKADEERIVIFSNLLQKLREGSSFTSSSSSNGNAMPIDETVWNVEALLNASYASAGEPFAHSSVKKDSILVPLNASGTVDEVSLPTVYESVRVKLAQQFSAVSSTNKHLVFIDIQMKGLRNSVNFANPEMMASFEITSLTGYDEPEGIPFAADDNWRWGLKEGKCNPVTGAAIGRFVGSDAATALSGLLNIRYPKPIYRDYYTDVNVLFWVNDPPNGRTIGDPDERDNSRDFPIYEISAEFPERPTPTNIDIKSCIESADMDFYYQSYYNFINLTRLGSSKGFVSIDIQTRIHSHTAPLGNHTIYSHTLFIAVGDYHRSNCGVICSCEDTNCVPRICGGSSNL